MTRCLMMLSAHHRIPQQHRMLPDLAWALYVWVPSGKRIHQIRYTHGLCDGDCWIPKWLPAREEELARGCRDGMSCRQE